MGTLTTVSDYDQVSHSTVAELAARAAQPAPQPVYFDGSQFEPPLPTSVNQTSGPVVATTNYSQLIQG